MAHSQCSKPQAASRKPQAASRKPQAASRKPQADQNAKRYLIAVNRIMRSAVHRAITLT
ncbi:hypothetical protein PSEUDO8Z_150102 [Pseudomonas sp. 8Z]|nr:hypothetical protein PSEUDO8Z_150102 [Pseudomonas sp. 8Z]